MLKNCAYCSKPYLKVRGNHKYCTTFCASRVGVIQKRLRQKKINETVEPRKCRRCLNSFYFYGMKKYCKDCLVVLDKEPNNYKKVNKGKL